MSEGTTANKLSNTSDAVYRVWLITIGAALVAGTIYTKATNNTTSIEQLELSDRTQETRLLQLELNRLTDREFQQLIQTENENDHERILEAIEELRE